MARRPAHLERVGALTPRDRMWGAIRAFSSHSRFLFSSAEISVYTEIHVATVLSYVDGLVKAKYLEMTAGRRPAGKRDRREFALCLLVNDVGVEAPRVDRNGKTVTQGLANQQMWNTLRVLKDFNATELALAASTPEQGVSEENAVFYCQYLKKAGYLIVTREAKPGTKATFRFVKARNSGPRAPLIQKDKSVMDANTGRVVWQKP